MAIPKKGSRNLATDDHQYRWLIRKKPTYSQGAFQSNMTVAVQSSLHEHGQVLVADLCVSRPDNWIEPHQTGITPGQVRGIITKAIAAGWQVDKPGPTFHFTAGVIKHSIGRP